MPLPSVVLVAHLLTPSSAPAAAPPIQTPEAAEPSVPEPAEPSVPPAVPPPPGAAAEAPAAQSTRAPVALQPRAAEAPAPAAAPPPTAADEPDPTIAPPPPTTAEPVAAPAATDALEPTPDPYVLESESPPYSAPSTTPERPEPARRTRRDTADEPRRRGPMVGLSGGLLMCTTDDCRDEEFGSEWRFRGGVVGRMEFGYRARWIAPSLELSTGIGPMKYGGDLDGLEGNMRFLDVGGGLMLYPSRHPRLDPYAGLRFGYARAREHISVPGTDIEGDAVYSRFGLMVTTGVGVFVRPNVSVGPRFDITLPVSGNVCAGIYDGTTSDEECFDVSTFDDGSKRRLPRWWSLSLAVTFVLPGRGDR